MGSSPAAPRSACHAPGGSAQHSAPGARRSLRRLRGTRPAAAARCSARALPRSLHSALVRAVARGEATGIRWVVFGVLCLAHFLVFFNRVAPNVLAPDLAQAFALSAGQLGLLG